MAYNLFKKVSDELIKDKEAGSPPLPAEVTTFLGKLSLLEGVPLHNLIPDEGYLPLTVVNGVEQGSLKIFWLDPEWIESLLNGAISIADDNDGMMLKRAMEGKYTAQMFYDEAKQKAIATLDNDHKGEEFETELKAKLHARGLTYGDPSPTTAQTNWQYTGFAMRSSIIAQWEGLSVLAYGTDVSSKAQRQLRIVRLERVASDMLYCICEGLVDSIEITQPNETVYFDTDRLTNPPKRQPDLGVLDIKQIIAQRSANGPINSAAFAHQMLAKPLKTRLKITRD